MPMETGLNAMHIAIDFAIFRQYNVQGRSPSVRMAAQMLLLYAFFAAQLCLSRLLCLSDTCRQDLDLSSDLVLLLCCLASSFASFSNEVIALTMNLCPNRTSQSFPCTQAWRRWPDFPDETPILYESVDSSDT